MGWLWWSNFTWEDDIILLCWETLLDSAVDTGLFSLRILISPGHARRVVRDTEAAALIEQDHATVSVEPVFQILHGFLRHRIRCAPGAHFVSGPLGQDKFHDGFAPAGAGTGCAQIVSIATAADERRVSHTSRIFVERAAGGSSGSNVAIGVERDAAHGVMAGERAGKVEVGMSGGFFFLRFF